MVHQITSSIIKTHDLPETVRSSPFVHGLMEKPCHPFQMLSIVEIVNDLIPTDKFISTDFTSHSRKILDEINQPAC